MNHAAMARKPATVKAINDLTPSQVMRAVTELGWLRLPSIPEERRVLLTYAGRPRVQRVIATITGA